MKKAYGSIFLLLVLLLVSSIQLDNLISKRSAQKAKLEKNYKEKIFADKMLDQ